MINNIILQARAAVPLVAEHTKTLYATDPTIISMSLIGVGIVLVSLFLLYITFKYVAKLYSMEFRKKTVEPQRTGVQTEGEISGEVNAAIALALHLYRTQLHDNEDAVITMKKVARTYSPWSSKIYGLTRAPK